MKGFIKFLRSIEVPQAKWNQATLAFLIWGGLCLVANLFCTNANAFGGDQGYWADWVKKLADGGFGKFNGNYPPLYVFWLWVVSKVYVLFDIPIDKTFMLKFLCLWPVYFAHLALVDIACRLVSKIKLEPAKANLVLAFVALNPALLLDGPIWGQVDMFPCIFGIAALYCVNFRSKMRYAALFFALALLAKFQMILLLPIFGGIFIRKYKISWRGLPTMAVAIVLVLLPFLIAGNLSGMLSRAYVNTTSQYPYATYNAANLWMLTVGNLSADATPFFNLPKEGIWQLLSPAWIGKILFVIVSLYILKCSLFARNLRTTFKLATFSSFAFFLLLPGMHERYLIYAIPFACMWIVLDLRKSWFWVACITLLCAMNIEMVNGLKGGDLWPWISAFGVIVFAAASVHALFPKFFPLVSYALSRLSLPRFVPYVLLGIILVVELFCEVRESRPMEVELLPNQMYLTDLKIDRYTQEYGSPRTNRSVEGKTLMVKNRQFEHGIGSHASSSLHFTLPANAEYLDFYVGVDDEVSGGGSVKFIVKSDEGELWSSGLIRGNNAAVPGHVKVAGLDHIVLVIDADGDNAYDHADWLNLVLTLKK